MKPNQQPASPPEEAEASFADLLAAHEHGRARAPSPDEPRQGVVAAISGERVFVDIGGKSEGVIPAAELRQPDGTIKVRPGDRLPVAIVGRDDEGYLLLSPVAASRPRDWTGIQRAFEAQENIVGRVAGLIKGGLSVDIGVRAFLPASRSGCREPADLEKLVGQEISLRIIDLDVEDENVIVDRRAVLEQEAQQKRAEKLRSLEEGAVVRGTVRSLTDFGAFVDLGEGVEGLLHVGDLSWSRLSERRPPAAGEEVEVKILKIDFDRPDKPRLSLGIKQLTADPWTAAAERLRPGERLRGVVSKVTDFGAFVEIEPGVEGLVHVSEMSWAKRVRHPGDLLKAGDAVEAVVLSVSAGERRIALGLKQALGDPWTDVEQRFPLGRAVDGTVRKIENFGAFVEILEGVEGLLHVSDIAGDRRLKHPNEVLKPDQRIRVVVLELDREKRRIKLGLKQLQPGAIDEYIAEHKAGDEVMGRVTELEGGEARVELGEGVEGIYRPDSAPGSSPAARGSFGAALAAAWKMEATAPVVREPLEVGQVRSFRITLVDTDSKRIELG